MDLPKISEKSDDNSTDLEDSPPSISSELSYSSLDYEESVLDRLHQIESDTGNKFPEQLYPAYNPQKREVCDKQGNYGTIQKNEIAVLHQNHDYPMQLVENCRSENEVVEKHDNSETKHDSKTKQFKPSNNHENMKNKDEQLLLSFIVIADDEEIKVDMKSTDTIAQLIKVKNFTIFIHF